LLLSSVSALAGPKIEVVGNWDTGNSQKVTADALAINGGADGCQSEGPAMPTADPTQCAFLEPAGISKRYAGVRALESVVSPARRGKIHAVLSEHGAGKSSALIKINAGVVKPDSGRIHLRGVRSASPRRRRRMRPVSSASSRIWRNEQPCSASYRRRPRMMTDSCRSRSVVLPFDLKLRD
jgi:hypothetical protein